MSVNYKELTVQCPMCEIEKSIRVPEQIFAQKKFGTVKIQIPLGSICQHQFIVFVDLKGKIQGYEKIDIRMSLSTEETSREKEGVLTLRKLILMFGTYGIFSIIHAKLFNYHTYLLVDENFKHSEDLLSLIQDRLVPQKYRGDKTLSLIQETDYAKIKLDKESLVIDSHKHILQTPWHEKLKFEESMLKKALEIMDEEEQLLIVQKDIANFIKEAEYSVDILEGVKQIYEEELMEKLSKELMIPKVNHYRLNLLKEFIKRRISPNTASKIMGDYFGYLKTISKKK